MAFYECTKCDGTGHTDSLWAALWKWLGTWAMVDLFKLDRSALPEEWTPLCEVDPSLWARECIPFFDPGSGTLVT